jgi:hypothetical protein
MSYRDQKKYVETLRRYERKMKGKDAEDFKMISKRHKDDEDLNKETFQRLKELYEKYYVNREKKNFDDLFKKK